ncbi:endonuclease/exonuclease/phosphatase family protein [Costertonia aggregata]|uniref:Endonuclease/exonuclease/phosphatase family protein n=2 Tax=Costertonia aggregata TaxID=343403 RepID=A0A7H9AUQ9_9FLAO|nr:endonuclease/exonuclease/phosphatase family protein [Costertonia aggregata]
MSYNIKYDNVQDTVNNWDGRKEAMVSLIRHYGPKFIGMQEVLHKQLKYLDDNLASYEYIGVGRDDGKLKGEFSPIFYDTSLFELIKSETFWLSDTPDTISVGWDASMERICTYGLFKSIADDQKLFVFNTHFDHVGEIAREKSVSLIIKKINELNSKNHPIILMGDLNLMPGEKPIQKLQETFTDGMKFVGNAFYGPIGTFNGFDADRVLDQRIDYIFTKNLQVKSYIHIDDRMENNKYISDHLPVLLKFDYQ